MDILISDIWQIKIPFEKSVGDFLVISIFLTISLYNVPVVMNKNIVKFVKGELLQTTVSRLLLVSTSITTKENNISNLW